MGSAAPKLVEERGLAQQEFDLLAKLEHDVLDEAVPLAALLRTCLILAGRTKRHSCGSGRLTNSEGTRRAMPSRSTG